MAEGTPPIIIGRKGKKRSAGKLKSGLVPGFVHGNLGGKVIQGPQTRVSKEADEERIRLARRREAQKEKASDAWFRTATREEIGEKPVARFSKGIEDDPEFSMPKRTKPGVLPLEKHVRWGERSS
jgi:hypothetical protein